MAGGQRAVRPGRGLLGRLRWEAEVAATAVVFFTRIPLSPPWSPERLQASSRYFPWVGWLVGAVAAAVFAGADRLWGPTPAALLSTAATALLTGAFHEDGLADVFDGLGGGATAERALEIMKDSRLGTFGALALGLAVGTKVAALAGLGAAAPAALLAVHPLSRLAAALVIHRGRYARADDRSKAKPLSTRLSTGGLAVAAVGGLLPLAALPGPAAAAALGAALVAQAVLHAWFRRRLGGYTGDCLGATQQVAEIVALLAVLAVVRP